MLEDTRLNIFLKVAQVGSFTLAARELGISQPAVSQSITALEKSLGTQLFSRTRGEIYLTSEGLAFREYAERIAYWYGAAQKMFGAEGRATVNRPVRIAADPVVASYILPGVLSTIYASHPEANFTIDEIGQPEVADVEISMDVTPETMDFEGEKRLVGVVDAIVVCSPSNRSVAYAADAESKPFSTIAGIHVSNSFAVWNGYLPLMSPDLRSRVTMVSHSIEAIKSMVASSDRLVGIIPGIAAERELGERSLLRLPVTLTDYTFDCHFSPLPEFAEKTVCKLLIETIKAKIR